MPQFKLTGNTDGTLDPLNANIPITGDFHPEVGIQKFFVNAIKNTQSARVTTQINNQTVDVPDEDLQTLFAAAINPEVNDQNANTESMTLLKSGLKNFNKTNLLTDSAFIVQEGERLGLPEASSTIIYSPTTDIIPAAKDLNDNKVIDPGTLFYALASVYKPNVLAFMFETSEKFESFKAWAKTTMSNLNNIPKNTQKMLKKIDKITLEKKILEGVMLRKNKNSNNEDRSFARIFPWLLTTYAKQQSSSRDVFMMPFSINEMLIPTAVILCNLENHAESDVHEINAAWAMVNKTMSLPVKYVPLNDLSTFEEIDAAASAGPAAVGSFRKIDRKAKRKARAFKNTAATPGDIIADIQKISRKMAVRNKSQNVFTTTKSSFLRPSRRDPMDPNLPGKIRSQIFYPDIHIYLDCSGSVQEKHYEMTIYNILRKSQKNGVNVYFSSFSDYIVPEVLIKTKNCSMTQVWRQFKRIPKASGGTDFSNVWRYATANKKRQQRLSVMITDFAWMAHGMRVQHPKNFWYAPLIGMSWDNITNYATSFAQSMRHIDPNISYKFIGMCQK